MLPPFEIHQPSTVAEAIGLRQRFGESAAVYAGGSELILAMKEGLGAFAHLIDVGFPYPGVGCPESMMRSARQA